MGEMGDRMDRAGRYVLGLMDDDERERAEHDLEIDPAFRNAMVEVAERMHVFDHMPAPDKAPQDDWRLIKDRISAMPQMRPGPTSLEPTPAESTQPGPQAAFGRRRSDKKRDTIIPETPARTIGMGLHSAPERRSFVLAVCLIAAFVLGYVAGVSSVGSPPPAIVTAP